jgi:hypothetical protein
MERIAGAARCDIYATVYPQYNSRAAAHNLRAKRACDILSQVRYLS